MSLLKDAFKLTTIKLSNIQFMSNSRRKSPLDANLMVSSEKQDKRRFNKALRRETKAITKSWLLLDGSVECDFEGLDVLPVANEVMAQRDFGKKGKQYLTVSHFARVIRERILEEVFIPASLASIDLANTEQVEAEAARWYEAALRK